MYTLCTALASVLCVEKLSTSICGYVLALGLLAAYMTIVRYYRFQVINKIRRQYPDPDVILKDSAAAEAIFMQTLRKEFPLICRESIEFALFKTFSVPTVSKLLVATREFEKHPLRRAEDTELILSEIFDIYARIENERGVNGPISDADITRQRERGACAIRRLNELHGKYPILNDDYIFTLALFVLEPIRWIKAYEWREPDIREVYAFFKTMYDLGLKMNIEDIPNTLEALEAFKKSYEQTAVQYSPTNWQVAQPTLELLYSRVPRFMKPVIRAALPCMLEPLDRAAFGIEEPNWMMSILLKCVIRLRANFIRYFMLPRQMFWTRTPWQANENGKFMPNFCIYGNVYPGGYRISELGPEKFVPKCPMAGAT